MLTKSQYLAHPCSASSLPYWKAKSLVLPEGVTVVHGDFFHPPQDGPYLDEPYFRLYHSLRDLPVPQLPQGFLPCEITRKEYADHINRCYSDISVSEAELHRAAARPVYDASLWLAVKEARTGAIAATGIGELDREIGEGILEWIQVSEAYRGRGLGRYLVTELLRRMRGRARFATVSGQCNNPSDPERLYRKCGFTGSDIWHVLRK